MNPVLYAANATTFAHRGAGTLNECVSCLATEELNGEFTLEFSYPMTGKHFLLIQNDCIVKAKADQSRDAQLFRIVASEKPIDGVVTFHAVHISYQLSSVPVSPMLAHSAAEAISQLSARAVAQHPFTITSDIVKTGTLDTDIPRSIRSIIGGDSPSFVEVYGGEIEFDNYFVRINAARGVDGGVLVNYGRNLLTINAEESIEEIVTAVYPYWKSGDVYMVLPEGVVTTETTLSYQRIVPLNLTGSFETQPTTAEMRAAALAYIQTNGMSAPSASITLTFVEIERNRICLADWITVRFTALGVDRKAQVIKTVYDVLMERFDSIEVGTKRANMASVISGATSGAAERAAETAESRAESNMMSIADAITGASGGNIRLNPTLHPTEVLFMDANSIGEARKLWRFNINGFAYSNTGYLGQYVYGFDMNGRINASMITTGTLSANLVRAGVLKSNDEKFQISLDDGAITTADNAGWATVFNGGKIDLMHGNQISVRISGHNIVVDEDNPETPYGYGGYITAQGFHAVGFNEVDYDNSVASLEDDVSSGGGKLTLKDASRNTFFEVGCDGAGTGYLLINGEPLEITYDTAFIQDVMKLGYTPSASNFINVGENFEMNYDDNGKPQIVLSNKIGQNTDNVKLAFYKAGDTYWPGILLGRNGTRYILWNSDLSIFELGGGLYLHGDLYGTGGKNRLVSTNSFGNVALGAYETPTPYFGDIGEGVIGSDGLCYVDLDDIFAECIDQNARYQVFTQSYSEHAVWVSARTPGGFIVHGYPGCAFGYEIKAPQRDYATTRFQGPIDNAGETESVNLDDD